MPVVPFSPSAAPGIPDDLKPSQSHLLMAAAQMHEAGQLGPTEESKNPIVQKDKSTSAKRTRSRP
jgi:hypothetical protein